MRFFSDGYIPAIDLLCNQFKSWGSGAKPLAFISLGRVGLNKAVLRFNNLSLGEGVKLTENINLGERQMKSTKKIFGQLSLLSS